MTSEEIATDVGKPYASVQPRLSELRESGLVRDTGARRDGRYGKPIIVWRASEAEAWNAK